MEAKSSIPKAYSKFWRINRSNREATELALGLRAARKVAGHIGRNVKPVFWKGMAENESRFILLDPNLIKGRYPIPHKTYDLLVGQVVLEGLSAIEFQEWVKEKTLKRLSGVDEQTRPYIEPMVRGAENIYINQLAKNQIWSFYLMDYFSYILSRNFRDPDLPPTPESVSDLWQQKSILKQVSEKHHPYYEDLLDTLEAYTDRIRSIAWLPVMSQRREARIKLYPEMWQEIEKIISRWEGFPPNPGAVNWYDENGPQGYPDLKENEEREDEGDPTVTVEDIGGGLDPKLAEDVSVILDEKAPLVLNSAVAVDEPGAQPMETRIEKGQVPADMAPDEVQVRRMRNLFKKQELLIRQLRRRRLRRGLAEGKLDALRLYRAPVDGKIFKQKQIPGPDHLWQICIVADASASMSGREEPAEGIKRLGRPWEIAEKSFVSLAAAARGTGNLLDIYAYRAERNVCLLTQLHDGKNLYSVSPSGRTPSGQAIMAVGTLLKKKYKNSIIVHITDGAANCGAGLGTALDFCRRQNIEVFTLGCGCNRPTRDFLKEFFPPGHLYFLESIHFLADGLEQLLRQKILGSFK
ncbi:MAG: VWA domain-containing protein [Deltaproteobacteria bacterium]|nr:VWA domain-containing protein [Deltaproteobacteria bacterium]